jgi:lactoylglutathione lyase
LRSFLGEGIRLEFHAVRLLVRDFNRSLEFYKDVLGFSGWYDESQEYAYFEEKQLALFSLKKLNEAFNQDFVGLESPTLFKFLMQFEVDDVDLTCRDLLDRGVSFINRPHDQAAWGSRVAHFNDPDGNIIELYHPLPK